MGQGPRLNWRWLALAAACAAGLLWVALANGYPLLYFDTGAYLRAAADRLNAPVDRPLVYGWFIFATSLNASPWLTVVAQAAIAVWIMRRTVRAVDPASTPASEAACIAAAAALTSAPYFVGQLMPDFFAGILPLAIFLLASERARPPPVERTLMLLLVAVGVGSHASHFLIAAATVAALAVARPMLRSPSRNAVPSPISADGLKSIVVAIVAAALVVCATNYARHGRFELAPGSHAFLLARLLADGPAARHLERACPAAGYRLCAFLGDLPRTESDYLWGGGLEKSGGWLGSREESWRIIGRTLAEEPAAVVSNALHAAGRQLVTGDVSLDPRPIEPTHGTYRAIARRHPEDLERFETSWQQRGVFQSVGFRRHADLLQLALAAFALVAGAGAWQLRRARPELACLVVAVVSFYAANALVCGALSSVVDRYGARVAWPLAFAGIALVVRWMRDDVRRPSSRAASSIAWRLATHRRSARRRLGPRA